MTGTYLPSDKVVEYLRELSNTPEAARIDGRSALRSAADALAEGLEDEAVTEDQLEFEGFIH